MKWSQQLLCWIGVADASAACVLGWHCLCERLVVRASVRGWCQCGPSLQVDGASKCLSSGVVVDCWMCCVVICSSCQSIVTASRLTREQATCWRWPRMKVVPVRCLVGEACVCMALHTSQTLHSCKHIDIMAQQLQPSQRSLTAALLLVSSPRRMAADADSESSQQRDNTWTSDMT